MTDIQKYPGFVLRDMWIDGTLSDEDYSAEIARRVKIKTDKDALIRELVAALEDLMSWFPEKPSEPEWHLKAGELGADDAINAVHDAVAKAKAAGYSP